MRLLDINVLLALCDEAHEFYEAAWAWFGPLRAKGWATCPLTENGFVRILGHPAHPSGLGSISSARDLLEKFCAGKHHRFWHDDLTLRDRARFPVLAHAGSKALTDIYLLALAASKHGRFATFDRRINAEIVRSGANALEVIPV